MIHPQAIIGEDTEVGDGTTIWAFASVIRGAKLGRNCVVGSCAIIDGAILGNDCHIGHGAQVHPGTLVGNEVFIAPGAIICNDYWPAVSKKGFEIGRRHTVVLEDGAVIGAGAIILPGVRVRKGAMAAAGAVIESDIHEGMVWRRNGYMAAIPDNLADVRMRYAL